MSLSLENGALTNEAISFTRRSYLIDANGMIEFPVVGKLKIDLISKGVFNSPVYYLTQNDIVCVEPNESKAKS